MNGGEMVAGVFIGMVSLLAIAGILKGTEYLEGRTP